MRKHTKIWRPRLVGMLAASVVATAGATPGHAADGTLWAGGMGFDRQGRVVALHTADGRVDLPEPGGLYVRDPVSGEQHTVGGRAWSSRGEVRQVAVVDDLRVRVDVSYRASADGAVEVDGTVVDLTRKDRVLDTVFTLPLPITSGIWGRGSAQPEPFGPTTDAALQTAMPLAAVSNVQAPMAVAFAVPPDRPSRFQMSLDPATDATTFSIRQLWGLSPDAAKHLRSRAPFAFTVDLGVDPDWGYRSALQRYYDRSPEWFVNPAGEPACEGGDAYGTWQFMPRSYYEEPTGTAFHMAGRGLWDPETGAMATTLDEYGANDEWDADEQGCAWTLPYTIPGQREITDLETLPASNEDAAAALESWTGEPIPFAAANLTNSFDSADRQRQRMKDSGLLDPDGRYVMNIRNTQWGANSVTFPTNSDPDVFADDPGKEAMARHLLDEYVPQMLSDPRVDGIFSDSLWLWGRYFNYRKDHFPAADIPLTYTESASPGGTPRPPSSPFGAPYVPGLYNDFSNLEYLWQLRSLLHSKGKVLMTNGLRMLNGETRAFDGFASDIIGVEVQMGFAVEDDSNLAFLRDVAYHKPVAPNSHHGLGTSDWENADLIEQLWRRALLYGLAPGSSADLDWTGNFAGPGPIDPEVTRMPGVEAEFQRRYMPVLRTLLEAEWQPLTGIQVRDGLSAGPQGVRVERYGTATDFYLVIYNQLPAEVSASFTVDRTMVPGIDSTQVVDVLTGEPPADDLLHALRGDGSAQLASEQFHVLHFQS